MLLIVPVEEGEGEEGGRGEGGEREGETLPVGFVIMHKDTPLACQSMVCYSSDDPLIE